MDRQHYSFYLPLPPQAQRKASVGKSEQNGGKKDPARASADPATGRRRGTMRSKEHDDEEEQLRRALEESKREASIGTSGTGGGRRAGKRAREEGEE